MQSWRTGIISWVIFPSLLYPHVMYQDLESPREASHPTGLLQVQKSPLFLSSLRLPLTGFLPLTHCCYCFSRWSQLWVQCDILGGGGPIRFRSPRLYISSESICLIVTSQGDSSTRYQSTIWPTCQIYQNDQLTESLFQVLVHVSMNIFVHIFSQI